MNSITGLILAAGASTRMGQAKQLLPYGTGNLLQHAISTLLVSRCAGIRVVLGANEKLIRSTIEQFPVEIVSNPDWENGMASSLRAGLQGLPTDVDGILMALADQPLITTDWYDQLIHAFGTSPQDLIATRYQGKAGVPVIWGRAWFAQLQNLSGEFGARSLLRQNLDQAKCLEFPAAARDIDTPDDYEDLIAGGDKK